MRVCDVHACVEALLGEPVQWSSVKATLTGNLKGATPRFFRAARGRHAVGPNDSEGADVREGSRDSRCGLDSHPR
jgi:hypothetical protein